MLKIEYEAPGASKCECCGGVTTTLTRFISVNDEARGVYYAVFSDNHPDPHVIVLLSLGKWWDGTGPEDREAFAFRIWLKGDQFQVGIMDANEAGWPLAQSMGHRISRDKALAHPLIKEVFHISDHIVAEDEPIRAYFQGVHQSSRNAV